MSTILMSNLPLNFSKHSIIADSSTDDFEAEVTLFTFAFPFDFDLNIISINNYKIAFILD